MLDLRNISLHGIYRDADNRIVLLTNEDGKPKIHLEGESEYLATVEILVERDPHCGSIFDREVQG